MALQLTPEYLHHEYLVKGRSDRDIASEHNSYPNAVRRLRLKYGIPSRDKAEAQELALKHGRHTHPTKGRPRDEESRQNISEGMAEAWAKKNETQRAEHALRAKKQWAELSEAERQDMRKKATQAILEAGKTGSKLERFLQEGLVKNGFIVFPRKHGDLYLPDTKHVIQVDGISHFTPIWGEEQLERRQEADHQKTRNILREGMNLLRIKNKTRSLSAKRMREVLKDVLEIVRGAEHRLIEIEVAPSVPNKE